VPDGPALSQADSADLPMSTPAITRWAPGQGQTAADEFGLLVTAAGGPLGIHLARGGKMNEHAARDAQLQEQQFRSYLQEAAGPGPAALTCR
jgi:hypothetical protein